jgi:hypothetical protein
MDTRFSTGPVKEFALSPLVFFSNFQLTIAHLFESLFFLLLRLNADIDHMDTRTFSTRPVKEFTPSHPDHPPNVQ